jgi:putative transposase
MNIKDITYKYLYLGNAIGNSVDNNMQTPTSREQRGHTLAQTQNHVWRIDAYSYRVKSQSGNGEYYDVIAGELGWLCSCPDHMFRGVKCKHIFAVEFSLALRNKVEQESQPLIIHAVNVKDCHQCHSDKIVKHGIRHNKSGDIQRFFCNDCGKWFVVNLGFERMHVTPQIITSAMQLYFTGESEKYSEIYQVTRA